MALGYTEYEEGFRHGKRDYAVGLRSPALLTEASDYAQGYRAGIVENETIQREWLKREHKDETGN